MSATTDGGDIDPQAAAQKMRDEAAKREQEMAADTLENLSTKEWLETELEGQAQPYRIMGREFMFKPIGNERVEDILRLANTEAADLDQEDVEDLEDVDTEHLDDMPKFVAAMREALEENCLDEYMATEGMGKLPLEVLQRVFEDVAMGGDISNEQAERARKFREE